jgi:hypothetical protein
VHYGLFPGEWIRSVCTLMGHFVAQRRPAQMRFLFRAEHGDNFCLPSNEQAISFSCSTERANIKRL